MEIKKEVSVISHKQDEILSLLRGEIDDKENTGLVGDVKELKRFKKSCVKFFSIIGLGFTAQLFVAIRIWVLSKV